DAGDPHVRFGGRGGVTSAISTPIRLGEERFDIAFLDIRMPGMTGLELAERVVGEFGTGRAKLVAITASALKHEQQAYEEKGFDAFVPKPFRFEQICECMAQHLGVAFEYESQTDEERKQQMPPEEAKVELPGDLLDRLKQAAEVYSVTEFEEHLSEMEVLGETERRVAEQLRELSRDVQIDEILRILAGVRSRAG
ncbi:MAG: response regulator, partial [Verrucomicrobia bacterium]|nr:response regulator [Verrucomicrobiota bacterium]